jgi:hypothetical protein
MGAGALREPTDGGSATPPRPLRDRPLVRVGLLALVLIAAAGVARSCGSHGGTISQAEAIEIAREDADFTPCDRQGCVMVRAVQRGLPTRLVWIVGLAEDLDANGVPTRFQNVLVDARTGDVTR